MWMWLASARATASRLSAVAAAYPSPRNPSRTSSATLSGFTKGKPASSSRSKLTASSITRLFEIDTISQGRVTLDDVFPWSILFDSSCKIPRVHARIPATSFRTERVNGWSKPHCGSVQACSVAW